MPYSACIAVALAMLLIALSLNVSRLRIAHKVSFGDGGHKDVTMAMRAHGNSLEQSIVFVPLLYFIESYASSSSGTVLALGAAFIVLRLVYCRALFMRVLLVRQIAHALTMVLLFAAAAIIVWSFQP